MKIIGFNLTKILVEKNEKVEGDLEITQNIDIKNLLEEDIKIYENKAIKIYFDLKIIYSKNYAKIEFEGNILIIPDEKEKEKILESWKYKKISEDTRLFIFNFIMNKCNIKALFLEDDMGLPLHIPMPKMSIKK
jgi:hypothetical protein